MLPLINGKSWLDCTEEDLRTIIDCPEYAENEYIDYKGVFKPLLIPKEKTHEKRDAIAGFRTDVCAFANANGGYLVFGISEKDGIPHEIRGIVIDSKDKFELDIKTMLNQIKPRLPSINLHCIPLKNGNAVVVLFIRHDSFAPYIHLENENNYRIYKRATNSNVVMAYFEIRNMFTQSIVLEKEIERFRNERISFYYNQSDGADSKYAKFMILHIIPETFLDSNYNQSLFFLESDDFGFSPVFRSFGCFSPSIPMVEGLRYPGNSKAAECCLFNNGIAEYFYSFTNDFIPKRNNVCDFFPWKDAWRMIEQAIQGYREVVNPIFQTEKIFVGFSIIGCKSLIAQDYNSYGFDGIIDRNNLIMNTIVFDRVNDNSSFKKAIELLRFDYLLSLGIKPRKEL